MTKVTFTLDDATVSAIRALAARRNRPLSGVVRDAIAAYASQEEKLEADERARRLAVLDDLSGRPRTRPPAAVEAELDEVRRARRTGWRRASD